MNGDVYYVVERATDFSIASYVARHLGRYAVKVGERLPERLGDYRLIVLWNLRRVIQDLPANRNVVVFHSSDLPRGRGWAPIYHVLADGHPEHIVSAIFAAPEVDSGEIIAKARFRVQPCHTAAALRAIDEEVCVMLAAAILERFADRPLTGVPQTGEATFYRRRKPADNEVDIRRPLAELIPHLRACEANHPALLVWQGCRYQISLTPERPPGFPDDLRIEFPNDAHTP